MGPRNRVGGPQQPPRNFGGGRKKGGDKGIDRDILDGNTSSEAWEDRPIRVVDPEPINQVVPISGNDVSKSIKSATPEIILFDDQDLPIEIMSDLIFENIGGQELINISRTDLINSELLSYQLIKNLSIFQQEYNPNKILGIQQTSDRFFANFSIKFDSKSPTPEVYREAETGDIIIIFSDIAQDEEVEIQIATSGIIDEVDLI
jgi:hypothetical protein